MTKPTIATVALSGCYGCHTALLDAHEGLVDLLGVVDLVHSPFTVGDEIPFADIILIEGAVATEHDAEVAREARAKARTLVAMGSCSSYGGIGALRNLSPRREVVASAFGEGTFMGRAAGDGSLPELAPSVRALKDVVIVDAYVPGCAPVTADLVAAITALLAGEEIPAPHRNLCAECGRTHSRMLVHGREFVSDAVYSVMELDEIDPDLCFLEQGVICMGAMTREGCDARCVKANSPCRGCMGPSRLDFEQGAKMVDTLAAVLPAGAISFLDDLIGTGYRFTMPVSIFPTIYDHKEGGTDE
jgi:F420-non-reducing hydrogenase small subunit